MSESNDESPVTSFDAIGEVIDAALRELYVALQAMAADLLTLLSAAGLGDATGTGKGDPLAEVARPDYWATMSQIESVLEDDDHDQTR